MNVRRIAQLPEEVAKVVPLGESSELRHVVQPNVHKSGDAGGRQLLKEALGAVLRETDRVDLHDEASSPKSGGWTGSGTPARSASETCVPSPRRCRTGTC